MKKKERERVGGGCYQERRSCEKDEEHVASCPPIRNICVTYSGNLIFPLFQVFELCEGGELLNRLRDRSKPVPLVTTLLDYCLQVVKALTFLESKHYVHRDVAARNILLSKDEKSLSWDDAVQWCTAVYLVEKDGIRCIQISSGKVIWNDEHDADVRYMDWSVGFLPSR
ncbi:unnamed protein product [Heligmosomoides polygyrus]|uniref:Protein kinase domain-containing protein n=1 Tax=Heligmosomoides polygyrus TaxID=6339 RepID=A0A183GKD1_HELPZ|nr:unnamed protein product [Heligmosomoides polygyrus]